MRPNPRNNSFGKCLTYRDEPKLKVNPCMIVLKRSAGPPDECERSFSVLSRLRL
jgi:hypothetical protein